jgi:hypothetical protein
MAMPRKKWRTVYAATTMRHTSQAKADAYVRELTAQFAAGAIRSSRIRIEVDEGQGWTTFDVCDLAEWAVGLPATESTS